MNPPRYRGWNSFYDGWVTRHYSQPLDPAQDEAWQRGWHTADETPGAMRVLAFVQEVRVGHILPVTET